MSDDHRWLRSRAAQLAGLGIAAALVLAALALAAQARREAAVKVADANVQAALSADVAALGAALTPAHALALRLASDPGVAAYLAAPSAQRHAQAVAALERANPVAVGATLSRFVGSDSAVISPNGTVGGSQPGTRVVAGVARSGAPIAPADLDLIASSALDAGLVRRSGPGHVTVSAPSFSTQTGMRVVQLSSAVRSAHGAPLGFVTVQLPVATLQAAARAALAAADGVDVAVVDGLAGQPLLDSTRKQVALALAGPLARLGTNVVHVPSAAGLVRQDGHAAGWTRVTTADGQAPYTVLAYARHRPTLLADNLVPLLLALLTLAAAALLVWRRHWRAVRGATTDPVTGLPNRRQLLLELPRTIAGAAEEAPVALVLLDLNGFKAYNDRFGHQAGDKLLQLLARRIEASVGDGGTVYRLGGGEFCVVAPIHPELGEDQLVVGAVAALTERGDGFDIVPGCGVAVLPREAHEAAVALRIADQRLYANKQSGRRSASRQSTDVLLRALSERSPELGSHLHDVAELAGQVGARMGMSDEEIDYLLQAAELHDVGKMAIPDAILKKPGPLDQEEWNFIRGHTVIGERIVAAAPALAPVAALIRSSHERWDGSGYPDRLLGRRIPLGSRIIAVCDAFDAMIGPRPHRLGMTDEEALGELERCAGTQFDPEVVHVFAEAFAELTRGGRAAA